MPNNIKNRLQSISRKKRENKSKEKRKNKKEKSNKKLKNQNKLMCSALLIEKIIKFK